MTRRDWLLSTLAIAPVHTSAAARLLAADIVVLDVGSATVGHEAAGSRRVLFEQGTIHSAGLPGSTLKPLMLAALLERKLLKPDERLACPGGFHLAGHNLACNHVHPAPPFDAVEALAASCNYWFATMAHRLGASGQLAVLRHFGLSAQLAPNADQAGLQALGLSRVSASPMSLAAAYADLHFSAPPLVATALRAAVERGTGQRALTPRVLIAGKTGTATGAHPGTTVGWFAGWAYRAEKYEVTSHEKGNLTPPNTGGAIHFAVRVPGGTGGGEAAEQARIVAERWADGRLR